MSGDFWRPIIVNWKAFGEKAPAAYIRVLMAATRSTPVNWKRLSVYREYLRRVEYGVEKQP